MTHQDRATDQDCIPFTSLLSEVMLCHFHYVGVKSAAASVSQLQVWGQRLPLLMGSGKVWEERIELEIVWLFL